MFRRLPALRAEYAAGVRQLTSIEYWREVYPETRQAEGPERAVEATAPAGGA